MKVWTKIFLEDRQFFYYNLTKILNGFFYFLREVPGIKKLISKQIFSAYELKAALGIFSIVLSTLYSFLIKILAFAIVVFAHIYLVIFFEHDNFSEVFSKINPTILQQGAFLWFLLVGITWGLLGQYSVNIAQKTIDYYTEMSLSRNQFILGQKLIKVIKNTVYYFFIGLLYGYIANSLDVALFIPLSYLVGNLSLFLFCRWFYMLNLSNITRQLIKVTSIGSLLVIIVGFYYFDVMNRLTTIMTHKFLLPIWFILIFITFKKVWNYPKQNEFIQKMVLQSSLFSQIIVNKEKESNLYFGAGLKMKKQLQFSHVDRIDMLEGSEYLNKLLFSRYREVFNRKIQYLLIGFFIVVVSLISLRVLNISNYINERTTLGFLPLLFFLMYLLSFGKQTVQMVFINCDSSMLYYSFYRESNTILKGFTYRLKQVLKYNSLIISGILLVFVLLHILNNFYLSWQFFGILVLFLLALGLLFSFHELFIYYLLQPFTEDLSVRSPLYQVITWLFYYFSYINTQIKVVDFFYVICISIISILYVVVGLVVIYRMAPSTFRIKD